MMPSRAFMGHMMGKVIIQGFQGCTPEIIEILNNYKILFNHLSENGPLSLTDSNLVGNSVRDPIQISVLLQNLNRMADVMRETMMTSALFNLNEMASIELLLSDEAEVIPNPDMSRGLNAVLNYNSSQKTIVEFLENLLQAKSIIKSDLLTTVEAYNWFRESMALEFWSPQEIVSVSSDLPMMAFDEPTKHWSVKTNESDRQAILLKFIRDVDPANMNGLMLDIFPGMTVKSQVQASSTLLFDSCNKNRITLPRALPQI